MQRFMKNNLELGVSLIIAHAADCGVRRRRDRVSSRPVRISDHIDCYRLSRPCCVEDGCQTARNLLAVSSQERLQQMNPCFVQPAMIGPARLTISGCCRLKFALQIAGQSCGQGLHVAGIAQHVINVREVPIKKHVAGSVVTGVKLHCFLPVLLRVRRRKCPTWRLPHCCLCSRNPTSVRAGGPGQCLCVKKVMQIYPEAISKPEERSWNRPALRRHSRNQVEEKREGQLSY